MVKTFILCPGLERSGTTWLHKYLLSYENINFGDTKEYHYFDSILLKHCFDYVRINKKHDILYKFYENDINLWTYNYFYYFLNILNNNKITGDFSPGYSALEEEVFEFIKNTFLNFDVITKCIFLVRDPVERHISATTMRLQRNHIELNDNEYNKKLLENIKDPFFIVNANFENDTHKLKKVFDNNFLLLKHDNLFNDETTKKICNFLNLEHISMPEFLENKINKSSLGNIVFDDTISILKNHYHDQINFYNKI